jgi:hypothetical protein
MSCAQRPKSGNMWHSICCYERINPLGIESGMTEPIPLRGDFEPHAAQLMNLDPNRVGTKWGGRDTFLPLFYKKRVSER